MTYSEMRRCVVQALQTKSLCSLRVLGFDTGAESLSAIWYALRIRFARASWAQLSLKGAWMEPLAVASRAS